MSKEVYVNRYRIDGNEFVERVKLTPILIDTISRYNRNLTPAGVSTALAAGECVCTSFSYYKIADK